MKGIQVKMHFNKYDSPTALSYIKRNTACCKLYLQYIEGVKKYEVI